MLSLAGQILLTIAALSLVILTPFYDFDRRHVFHPTWPGHARYHAAAYTITNMGIGTLGAALAWLYPDFKWLVLGLITWPGIVMVLSALIPGVSAYADGEKSLWRLPVSLWGTLFYLGLCAAAALT